MAEDDVVRKYPSLPPNYVSIAQLQQRWLPQKQQQEEEEEEEGKQKQKEKEAAEKRLLQLQEQENGRKNRENLNKFGENQVIDRFGQVQGGPIEKKKEYPKEKGNSGFVRYLAKRVNSYEGLNLKSGENKGFDGNFEVKGGLNLVMAEDDVVRKYPSLPPNYVSIAQLQQRWLQQKQQQEEEEEEEGKQKQKEKEAAEKRLLQLQEQENGRKNRENLDKFGENQVIDRFGQVRGGPIEKKKGYPKEKGNSGFVRYLAKRVNSCEGLNLKSGENKGFDGNFEVKGGVGAKEGFRGEFKRNGGDHRSKFGVSSNVEEGGVERTTDDLEGERKEEKIANGGKGKQGYRKSQSKKGTVGEKVSSGFERLALEEGRKGSRKARVWVNVGKERISRVGSKRNGRKDECTCKLRRNADDGGQKVEILEDVGEGENADKKGIRLEGEKEGENVGVVLMNKDKEMKGIGSGGYRRNRNKKEVSRAKIRRALEDLHLNDERNGKGRRKGMMNVQYQKHWRNQTSATSRMGKGNDNGLMWVKKDVISVPKMQD